MIKRNPLLDEVFLQDLYQNRHKEIYAKIIALDKDENAKEQIEGQVTGGSMSLDGTSNVRRSCNLTVVTPNIDINAYYWGFKSKFRLFIGLNNTINSDYDNIIWFPMGTYVITGFSTSYSTNNYTINISGKDKMCLLNGELGGSVFATIDFGKEEVYNTHSKVTTINDIPIKTIVREAVHEYAGERWENIIINDLDDIGLELLDYKGKSPLYLLLRENGSNEDLGDTAQITLDGSFLVYVGETPISGESAVQISNSTVITYNPRNSLSVMDDEGVPQPTLVRLPGDDPENLYTIAKVEYNQTCGYRYTDITYAGDLILNTGEAITSMLDKLVGMLGNWEYFYDTDGRFIFQRKKTYLDKTWNNIKTLNDDSYVPTAGETYVESSMWSTAISWSFTDSFLVTSFNNTPALSNVKNDYSIWGTRQSITGAELPVHLRYAIDKKPTYYKTIEYDEEQKDENGNVVYDADQQPVIVHHPSIEWEANDRYQAGVYIDGVYTNESFESIQETLEQRINDEIDAKLAKYQKTPNKVQLSEDWWEVQDWAEYYYLLTKEYPQDQLRIYAREGVSIPDLNRLIPKPIDGNYYYNGNYPLTPENASNYRFQYTDERGRSRYFGDFSAWGDTPINVIDVNEDGTLGYYGHGTVCSHSYDHFLNNAKFGITSYVYNPQIPDRVYKHFSEEEMQEWSSEHIVVRLPVNSTDAEIEEYAATGAQIQLIGYCDWRELIFQMAKDYRRHMHDDEFLLQVQNTNGLDDQGEWYYPGGKTGYEQYYTDLEGFWRQLYCPPCLLSDWAQPWSWTDRVQAMGISVNSVSTGDGSMTVTMDNAAKTQITYCLSTNWVAEGNAMRSGWNQQVIDEPASLNFWFDFLSPDDESDFARYSVPAIGDRAKSVNDSNVKAIYFREIPNTIFTNDLAHAERKSGYTYMQYQPSMERLFNISSQGKCAMDVLEEWLNNYVYAIESVNMATVPVYHLQPHTRIKVMDMNSKINGDYIVSRISIPLTYNGTMSITATKVSDTVY